MDANNPNSGSSYAFNGRIMLILIASLFGIVTFMICFHFYTRWYLFHIRRRQARLRARRRSHLVFSVDNGNLTVASSLRGLDSSVISLVPEFVYSSKEQRPEEVECAVCLSVFEEGEKGRVLPKCGHSFHIDCIDMWFHSHSTCPLCRSPVEPMPENCLNEVSVSVAESVLVASSDLSPSIRTTENDPLTSSSSLCDRRKEIELVIDVPMRNESDEEEGTSSAPSQGFKSPGTRLRSFRRILSMNRKGIVVSPPPSGVVPTTTESDVERGSDESTTHQ